MNDILFGLLVAFVITVLSFILKVVYPIIKEKVVGTKFANILPWVDIFVKSAEVNIMGGADKKTWVTEELRKMLLKKNLNLTDTQISSLVDAIAHTVFPHDNSKEAKTPQIATTEKLTTPSEDETSDTPEPKKEE